MQKLAAKSLKNHQISNIRNHYSKVLPLRNSLHKDSLIGFLCQDILLQTGCVYHGIRNTFILQTAIKIAKKTFLKYALLCDDAMV